jgi:hypothetical protein
MPHSFCTFRMLMSPFAAGRVSEALFGLGQPPSTDRGMRTLAGSVSIWVATALVRGSRRCVSPSNRADARLRSSNRAGDLIAGQDAIALDPG